MTRRVLTSLLLAGAVALPAAPAAAQCEIFGCILRGCYETPDTRFCW